MTAYKYTDLKGKDFEVILNDDLSNKAEQAKKDYNTSYKYVQSTEYYTWRYALKAYHLSTYDRKTILKTWQQNIAVGIIRSFVDVLVAVVQERPLTFIGTPINKLGLENKENILRTLNYISDVTGFHRTIKQSLKNGLILGTICFRVNYIKTEKRTTVTSIINGEASEEIVEVADDEIKDYPCATSVPIFNIFPDPYTGKLRYVTERIVMNYFDFKETFGKTIESKFNLSPLKSENFIKTLPSNQNGATFYDYGIVTTQVHQKINEELREKDKFSLQTGFDTGKDTNSALTHDEDKDVTEGLIEVLYTCYPDRIVIHANNYPVYIGKNFYGFIPYVIKAAGDDEMRFGEGIPYMLRGIEEVANSFVNNYFDGARALATPTFVGIKNLLINESQLESGQPGGVLWLESGSPADAISRLDKGGLNDFNIYGIVNGIAQQITGISEYNLGQSAGERTATGSLAVTQSSNKRVSPYISAFVDAVSIVAQMWLSLVKKNWTKERFIYVLDDAGNQTFEAMQNNKLTGGINISLQAEGLFGSTNELEMQKLISVYQTLAPSGFVKSPEIAKEIMKKAGFTPSRFIIETEQLKPDEMGGANTQVQNPEASIGDILKEAANPQVDMGNGGEGQK